MTVITKKVRLVAAPEPPFVGTVFTVKIDDPADGDFKITSSGFAAGHTSVTIDWGDGTPPETFGDVIGLTHAYANAGTYTVKVSDDLASIGCPNKSTTPYGIKLTGVVCNARNLTGLEQHSFYACTNLKSADFSQSVVTALPARAFSGCTALEGSVAFKNVRDFAGAASIQLPFYNCSRLSEIHFSAENREAIEATEAYNNDHTLGSGTAVVKFDL